MNVLGLCKDDVGIARNNIDRLEESLKGYFRTFGNELFNREILYYRHLLKSDVSEADFDKIITNLALFEDTYRPIVKVSSSHKARAKEGYAVLDSRTERFFINKPCSVIGREPEAGRTDVVWMVDVPVRNTKNCSKQQALLLFNFETGKFEVKCISAKIPIDVDGKELTLNDLPQPVKNGSVITIGGEVFHFFAAKEGAGKQANQLLL